MPIPFDMNEVPEGTIPRNEPPPPLPPKVADFGDELDAPPPSSLPPKPPRHGGGSKRAPVPVPATHRENIEPLPTRPPKPHGYDDILSSFSFMVFIYIIHSHLHTPHMQSWSSCCSSPST